MNVARGVLRTIGAASAIWAVLVFFMLLDRFPNEAKIARDFRWTADKVLADLRVSGLLKDVPESPVLDVATQSISDRTREVFGRLKTRNAEYESELAAARTMAKRLGMEAEADSSDEVKLARQRVERATKAFHNNPTALTSRDESEALQNLSSLRLTLSQRANEARQAVGEIEKSQEVVRSAISKKASVEAEIDQEIGLAREQRSALNTARLTWIGDLLLWWAIPTFVVLALFVVAKWIVRGFFGR